MQANSARSARRRGKRTCRYLSQDIFPICQLGRQHKPLQDLGRGGNSRIERDPSDVTTTVKPNASMRLINIYTQKLEFWPANDIPPYAILSHRWLKDEDEITFEQYVNPTPQDLEKPGYRKVEAFCSFVRGYNRHKQAKGNGKEKGKGMVEWIWIDTCCIDKRSSAELSESINSMAMWYQRAEYCVAYLVDVPSGTDGPGTVQAVWKSSWFTRGWCLQELLFPEEIVFCNVGWKIVGEKSESRFCEMLSSRTGIPGKCLTDRYYMLRQCVARKMSWASGRTTTRTEDLAYCLLGLFNIQISLLYGEGVNAFARLQEEIINQTDDESIFAWSLPRHLEHEWESWRTEHGECVTIHCPSALAPHPEYFMDQKSAHLAGIARRKPYRITNKGLEFEAAQAIELQNPELNSDKVVVVELNCGNRTAGENRQDRSCLMAVAYYRNGRYGRLQADPRRLAMDWVGDEFLWQYLSGYDASATSQEVVNNALFYIKVSRSARVFGTLNFNDTHFMENFVTLDSVVGNMGRYTRSPRGSLAPDDMQGEWLGMRRPVSHSPRPREDRRRHGQTYVYPLYKFAG